MEKYSRYIDANKRLLVVLFKWHKIVDNTPIPTTVDILVVNEERVVEYPISEFEGWIDKKLITKIK